MKFDKIAAGKCCFTEKDVRNCWMESILVDSSSQPEPISIAASEYATLPRDGEDRVKKKERRISNEREPMYPTMASKKAKAPVKKVVYYDEPFQNNDELVQNHDKYPITDGENDQAPTKPTTASMPEQFKDYTDDELEQLAIALSKTLKRRQDHGSDSKLSYVNEPRERHAEREEAGLAHRKRDDVKLDTIFENFPVPDIEDAPTEVPPPLPVKKRRHRVDPSPNEGDTVTEGRMSEGNPAQSVDNFSSTTEHFRKRLSGDSRRKASLRRIADISAQLTQHMDPISEEGETESPQWTRASKTTASTDGDEMIMLPKELVLNKSSIHNLKLIAAGNFDRVYKGNLSLSDGKSIEVTVKGFIHKSEKEKKSFQNEMIIMSGIMHPNIVRLYGIISGDNSMVVLEYMANGNLRTYLQENPRPVTKLVKFMNDIVMGMHHLSELGLVHRDLAARNILVSAKELCKVADLGQAIELPKEGDKCHIITDTTKIPIRWCAPEYLKEMKCSVASDVWSFGVLMWEMANPGKFPYDIFSNSEVVQKIQAGYTLTIPSKYPKDVQNIMKSCWNHKPEKRPNFLYIFMHLNRVNFHFSMKL